MKYNFYVILVCVFNLIVTNQIVAQVDISGKNILLRDYLLEIESVYKVKFSYSDVAIQGKYVKFDKANKKLSVVLDKLRQQTSLNFEILKDRYIIISESNLEGDYEFCGYIYDDRNRNIIEGANIFLKRLNKGVISDSRGFFGLNELKETDSICVSFVGLELKKIPFKAFKDKKCLEIFLKKEIMVLEEVLISEYLAGGVEKQSDGSIIIAPQKLTTISGFTEPDVLKTIKFLFGINSPNGTTSDLFIRGGKPEENLILFDGIKMYSSSHLFGMISAINPYVISDVKIYKSGTSSEYGNHISGVLDIKAKEPNFDNMDAGVGLNMTHFDAYVNVPLGKKLGAIVSGRRSLSDILKTPTFNNFSDKVFQNSIIGSNPESDGIDFKSYNDFYFFDFNTKITYELSEDDMLTFSCLKVENELDYLFNTINSDDYVTRDFLNVQNTGWYLNWKHQWGYNTTQTTGIYYSGYDFLYTYNGKFNFDQEPFNQNALKANSIKDFGFKTTVKTKTNEKTSFLYGYELVNNRISYKIQRESDLRNRSFQIADTKNNNSHSLFLDYGYKNKNNTILNLGLRTNYFSLASKAYLAPRIYFEQKISPKWFFKTSYEFKQQIIGQFLENYTSDFGLENHVWLLIDNKELPVLRNHQYSSGFIYKFNDIIFDLDFYKKHGLGTTSYTMGTVESIQDLLEGTRDITGFDLLLKKSFRNFDSWINYSYSKSTYTFDQANGGKPFPSSFDITNSFQWANNLKFGDFSFSLAWLYRTGAPYSEIDGVDENGNIISEELNSRRLTDYHRLDISSSYEFSFDKDRKWIGRLGISLQNFYDRNNNLYRKHDVIPERTETSFKVQQIDKFSLGFTPNLVMRLFFK